MTSVLWTLASLALGALTGSAAVKTNSDDTVEIAPGVHMPLINLGGVHSKPSNYSLWLELGGRGLDTAWSYGADVQSSVGRAVASSSIPRSELFITTKVPCCPDKHTMGGYACPSTWGDKSPDEIVKAAAEADLEQLNVQSVDLILMHQPCDRIEDTITAYKALEDLKASGKTRAIGISNFNHGLIDELMPAVNVKPAINQCGFSIGNHEFPQLGRDLETLRHCQKLGITYSAYSPLGGLSGVDVLSNPDVIAVAQKHNRTTAQVALRWVVQQGVVAVTASNKASHDLTDLDIFSFTLADDEMKRLTAIGKDQSLVV